MLKKSPKWVAEHGHEESDDHQGKSHLVGHLGGVVVRSFVRHGSSRFNRPVLTLSTYGGGPFSGRGFVYAISPTNGSSSRTNASGMSTMVALSSM